MTLPTSERIPSEDEKSLPPARRRRRQRMILPGSASKKAAFLEELAHLTTPSFDFFLFSIITGLLLGIAILVDVQAFYVLAALACPFMAPVFGLSLASVFGSSRFFFRTLGGTLSGSGIIFLIGALTGWATRFWPGAVFIQAPLHAYFTWPDFIVLTCGTIIATIQIVRNPKLKPHVASVALAYEIYLPLGVAGFGLVSGFPNLWPGGLIVFVVHLAWAALIGTLTFAVLSLRPNTIFGYTLGSSLALIAVSAVIAVSGFGTALSTQIAMPTLSPTPTSTLTLTPTATVTV
ncbi:MAG: DUF389 domain-containing protein, partial [Anaerolineaceae bacterium]|nr:DUF389 domain-containing protein [Anaerolineaceae bacterium]